MYYHIQRVEQPLVSISANRMCLLFCHRLIQIAHQDHRGMVAQHSFDVSCLLQNLGVLLLVDIGKQR